MASRLPQDCRLWLGVEKGMLLVSHLAQQILMAVHYCGCQVSQKLEWVAPAHIKNEGVTPHPGVCRYSMQYERRPDWCIGWMVDICNMVSLSGNGGVVWEELRKKLRSSIPFCVKYALSLLTTC